MGTTKRGVRRVEFRGFRGHHGEGGERKGPHHPSIVYPKSPEEQEKGAALKESGAFAQISSRGGTGEYLPIAGSTHSDPPSSR